MARPTWLFVARLGDGRDGLVHGDGIAQRNFFSSFPGALRCWRIIVSPLRTRGHEWALARLRWVHNRHWGRGIRLAGARTASTVGYGPSGGADDMGLTCWQRGGWRVTVAGLLGSARAAIQAAWRQPLLSAPCRQSNSHELWRVRGSHLAIASSTGQREIDQTLEKCFRLTSNCFKVLH